MKRLLLSILFLSISFTISAQKMNIDSLWFEINKTHIDTSKVNLFELIAKDTYYKDIDAFNFLVDSMFYYSKKAKSEFHLANSYSSRGRYFVRLGKLDSTKFHYYNALKIYKKINKKSDLAIIYGNIGSLFLEINDKDSTEFYLNKAIEINSNINDDTGLFFNYYNLGVLQSRHNDSDKSTKSIIKALEYAEKTKNNQYIAYCHSMLGVLYMELEIYDKAKEYLDKSIMSFKILENFSGIGTQYTNLGVIASKHEKNYVKAIRYHKKALVNHTKVSDNRFITTDFSNIGNNFLALKKLDSARYYLNKGLHLSDSINFTEEKGRILRILGEIAFEEDSLKIAKSYLLQSLALTKENNFLIDYTEGQLVFSRILAKEGHYKEAYNNLINGSQIKDSINATEKLEKLALIETKYQTEKKEKENLQLKQEKTEQAKLLAEESKRKWQLGGGLIAAMIALGIFTFYYRRNQKQKEVIENLQKELHHRIKNNLSVIDAFIDVIKDDFDDEIFTAKLTELQMRIDSINEVHLQLYNNKDVTNLNIKKYIDTLAENVSSSFNNSNISVNKKVKENVKLDADKTFPVGLIINEFLTNSYKYAFGESSGEINIEMKDLGQIYSLNLSDNGKGLPDEFDISKTDSFGLRLMNLLTKQLNGSLQITNNNGMQLAITFPK